MVILDQLLKNVSYKKFHGNRNQLIGGITADSRRVRQNFIYVAVSGQHFDGSDFIQDAIVRGARLIVSEKHEELFGDCCLLEVKDSRDALAQLAANYYDNPSHKLHMIGITGTNGKTTVAHLIEWIIKEPKPKVGMLGTIDYRFGDYFYRAQMTTPEAPFLNYLLNKMVEEGIETTVMEVSSHALKQKRTAYVDFDTAIFTNLTKEHLDYHKSIEEYLSCKTMLFKQLNAQSNKNKTGIINMDDPCGQYIFDSVNGQAVSYGIEYNADIRAVDIQLHKAGARFVAHVFGKTVQCSIRLPGKHNVYNALAAIAASYIHGTPLELIADRLAQFSGVPGRLQSIDCGQTFTVYVDYAHTEDALKQVITTIKNIHQGRIIVVFGCGGDRDASKRPLMGEAVCSHADYAVITSDNPRNEDPVGIIDDIKKGIWSENYCVEIDRKKAIGRAVDMCGDNDVLLIAGKGHEKYQIIGHSYYPFDDAEVVKYFLPQPEAIKQKGMQAYNGAVTD